MWNISFNFKNQQNYSNIQKGSKLECSNCRPISVLSNIEKILERLMYSRRYSCLEKRRTHIFTPTWFSTEVFNY